KFLICESPGVGLAFSVSGQENTCDANGSFYYVGECHFLDSDHCTQCEWSTVSASYLLFVSNCIYVSSLVPFGTPSSVSDSLCSVLCDWQPSECEQCTCDSDGIARCLVADCAPPPPPCVNPVNTNGKCCPECPEGPSCYVDLTRSQVIPGGDPVWVDSCTKCHCHDSGDAGCWKGNR
uniref:VWFC domain-containing protein n=1 Tax=Oncorhynchus mykiss TaxID=8022 RepID=A0A8C7QKN0_ONCMY